MTIYVSLLGATLVLIVAVNLFHLLGPFRLLLPILVAILLWLAFRGAGTVATV